MRGELAGEGRREVTKREMRRLWQARAILGTIHHGEVMLLNRRLGQLLQENGFEWGAMEGRHTCVGRECAVCDGDEGAWP